MEPAVLRTACAAVWTRSSAGEPPSGSRSRWYGPDIRADVRQQPGVWGELCGWYRPLAQRNDTMVWALAGAGVEVFVHDGQLWLRAISPIPALCRGFPLHPDDPNDPYAFRIDLATFELGTAKVVFSHERATTRLHLAGLVPMSAEQRPEARNPRVLPQRSLGVLGIASALAASRRWRTTA